MSFCDWLLEAQKDNRDVAIINCEQPIGLAIAACNW